jgi:hypothetical protein
MLSIRSRNDGCADAATQRPRAALGLLWVNTSRSAWLAVTAAVSPIPAVITRGPQLTLRARFRRFDLTEHQNRLDGSPWSESGKPARHIGAIAFILGSEVLAERRLLIGDDENVKKEPDQRAVAEEMPVSE